MTIKTIMWNDRGWEDYLYWQNNAKILKQINKLIKVIQRTPYEGLGNPEALRYEMTGYWSRRIDREHRLIYKVIDDTVVFIQCRHHY